VCVYVHMHTNSLCICIHTHTHTHTHTHLVCIPSTGITAFVFSTVPLLAFVVCFFVLCNRHYVIDTGSTGPRARRLAELGVSYLTPAVAQALAWVRSYLFFFFKTRTTRGVKGHIFCISAPWYAAGYGPVPGTARDSRPSLCFPFSHVCLATDVANQRRKNYQAAGHFLVLGLGCALVRVWCCGRYLAHHVTACGAQFRGPATMSTVDWRNKAIEIARKATDLDKEAEKMEEPDKQVSVRRGCIGLL